MGAAILARSDFMLGAACMMPEFYRFCSAFLHFAATPTLLFARIQTAASIQGALAQSQGVIAHGHF
jgi:hypothetical protein